MSTAYPPALIFCRSTDTETVAKVLDFVIKTGNKSLKYPMYVQGANHNTKSNQNLVLKFSKDPLKAHLAKKFEYIRANICVWPADDRTPEGREICIQQIFAVRQLFLSFYTFNK